MAKVITEIDWNGHHYTFTNTFKSTGTKNHDILTMEDENGNSWTGETTWINRPWHRFDLEEAFSEIVGKAFGKKALDLIYEINETANSVEDAIATFFEKFDPKDIQASVEQEEENDESEDARRKALAAYLEVEESDVEPLMNNEFEVGGETYLVLTDSEADDQFDDRIREYWEDYGFDGVSDYMRDWIIENALDEGECEDLVREDIEQQVWDMDDEEVANELIDLGLVATEDVFDDETYELKDDIDFDDYREQLIDAKIGEIDNFSEYLIDSGFDEEYLKNYIDDELVIDALKDDIDVNGSGRGQEIAWYDGEEHDIGRGFFAYRID